MNVLEEYEAASGQKINKEKSSVYMLEGAQGDEVNTIHLNTEFQRHSFPFTYLGCPIFHNRRRKEFYKNIIFKVQERLSSWKGKLLSIGGREVLISHVLESMPIHLLSVVNPPVYVINQLHKMFARFYWSNSGNGRTGIGALYHASGPDHWCDESIKHVDEVVENGAWNEVLPRKLLPDELADHILEIITPPSDLSMKDKPWWKLETKGYFTLKSAWNPKQETLPHVFLTSPAARYVWNYYGAPAGIRTDGKQLVQVINEWWSKPVNTSLKAVYQAMPSLIVWHLWKKIILESMGRMRRPGFKGVTANWPDLHEKMSQHIPKLRGVNGGASYGFCIRNRIGDIIYAHADAVEDVTNNVAEAQAILMALRVLDEVWEPPWSIANQMDEIKILTSMDAFQIFHVLREGNKLADHSANLRINNTLYSFMRIILAIFGGATSYNGHLPHMRKLPTTGSEQEGAVMNA
nr:uncharacterized protein LOC117278420 [Nicotiana tomentosiformis]